MLIIILILLLLIYNQTKAFAVPRRKAISLILSTYILSTSTSTSDVHLALAAPPRVFREYVDAFDGYSFKYPGNWIPVRGAGADIFFRDPYILDENLSLEISSPSSSQYKSVQDLGSPQQAGQKVLKQLLTEFMSTRLGVRRESNILSTSSRVADDGKLYYQVEVGYLTQHFIITSFSKIILLVLHQLSLIFCVLIGKYKVIC